MRPLSGLGGHDTTLFLLGVDEWFADSTLNREMSPDVDRIARSGGRLVIAFVPQRPRLESEVEIERQLTGDRTGDKGNKKASRRSTFPLCSKSWASLP